MGNLLDPVQGSDVIQRVNARRQSTVETEDLVLDQGGQGQEVEKVGKVFPNVCIAIFPEAFIIETVDLGDLS